ncbi:MAG TPA: 2-dehydropantoate 2-reductase N-terminal domain-containing protein [Acidimicrobiales bacterium]|nr:2-dehydropantoate 2-reductase N-terminal domain-containing protein [Acidimicrobiales bacterium]
MALHVIVGAGPVGSITALMLADAGEHVRMVTRGARGPKPPLIDRIRTKDWSGDQGSQVRVLSARACLVVDSRHLSDP